MKVHLNGVEFNEGSVAKEPKKNLPFNTFSSYNNDYYHNHNPGHPNEAGYSPRLCKKFTDFIIGFILCHEMIDKK